MVIRDQVRQQLSAVALSQRLDQFVDQLSEAEVRQLAVLLLRELREQGQLADAERFEDELDSLDLVDAVTSTPNEATYAWQDVDAELDELERQSR
jgi:hypothetical protein